MAEAARDAAAACRDLALPEALRTGAFTVLGSALGQVWLPGCSGFDPLVVAPEVLTLAPRCDGRRWQAMASEHAALHSVRPGRVLLRTLLDHGIVEAADEGR